MAWHMKIFQSFHENLYFFRPHVLLLQLDVSREDPLLESAGILENNELLALVLASLLVNSNHRIYRVHILLGHGQAMVYFLHLFLTLAGRVYLIWKMIWDPLARMP
jgi:hypothetical protein